MARHLFVILGAGASYDCTSLQGREVHEDYKPPLVTELFETRPRFSRILEQYPLAQQAAADVRRARTGESLAIEAFLRDKLLRSPHVHNRRKYWSVPLYFQHLLTEISEW